eukprot:CAMPEP_0201933966 /NCGR_PEP_ID=MMETSP0903-20130614/32672_1 /ASSEMBLY_ACC=CAM_ASM_000552 /TAXON_ID=420261 /ORGANISM="Thalassiosira antarctica, Strain CCMP982" /LENGTH=294 /DNA_ID=CAMNT_0048474055 /DNA_START=46 /DNA_END=926 /DNA_ORIENTATION=+
MKIEEEAAAMDAMVIAATNQDDVISGSGAKKSKRKLSESTSSTATSNDAESSSANDDVSSSEKETATAVTATTMYDDAGSSRLFQPHRSLGLLTAATPTSTIKSQTNSPSSQLFQSQKGKFHLQPQALSSEETFVTVPLGERFQIMTLSKLVPVMVSRALPPSASHHRPLLTGDAGKMYKGGDEEEMHQAVSDSSLSITVATHGPKVTGRAVSITLYSRTRPLVCLDAFPFLDDGKKKKKNRWGIVDVVHLGKQRVAMSGEKEGKMENALLFAVVCAKDDASDKKSDDKGREEV